MTLHILHKLDLDLSLFRPTSTIHTFTAHRAHPWRDEVMHQPRCFTKTQREELSAPRHTPQRVAARWHRTQ